MRRKLLILTITILANSFYGHAQADLRDYEKCIFFNFVDSLRYPNYSFLHSSFMEMTENVKRIKLSKIPSDYKHMFLEDSPYTSIDDSKEFVFSRRNDSNSKTIRKGIYSFSIFVKNDSVLDCYYIYPPDTNSKIVEPDQLFLFINLIRPANFYLLLEYGNEIFKSGKEMNSKYNEILKDYVVNGSGRYPLGDYDRFVFFNDRDANVDLYINKKTKRIKEFVATMEKE